MDLYQEVIEHNRIIKTRIDDLENEQMILNRKLMNGSNGSNDVVIKKMIQDSDSTDTQLKGSIVDQIPTKKLSLSVSHDFNRKKEILEINTKKDKKRKIQVNHQDYLLENPLLTAKRIVLGNLLLVVVERKFRDLEHCQMILTP